MQIAPKRGQAGACAFSPAYYEINIKEKGPVSDPDSGDGVGRSLPDVGFDDVPYRCGPWQVGAGPSQTGLPQTPPVFAIGNGFIGVRGPGEERLAPRVYLNGTYERVPISYHEAAFGYAAESDTRMAAADATRPRISVDGSEDFTTVDATLDLATACCTETLDFGGTLIRVDRFASMTSPSLVAIRVRAPAGARIDVAPSVEPPPGPKIHDAGPYDPRVSPHLAESPWHSVVTRDEPGLAARVDRLRRSEIAVAALCAELARRDAGDEILIDFVACYVAHGDEPLQVARGLIASAREVGFDNLLGQQRNWFDQHWSRSEVSLPDDPVSEGALRHGLLQLVQGVARDDKGSLPAKGQTGEGYEGHVFWDADLYALPVFAWTRPDIARAMLSWRIAGLDAAGANARAMGHGDGALFPWRTIAGRECSSFFPAGTAQYHINADIAFALRTYLDATGDRSILAEGGARLLAETARIWLQIGFHDPERDGAFVINRVTGPDEYSAIVDNNLYTNLMAAEHLRFAAEEGEVGQKEADAMRRAAEAMFLPYDRQRGIFAQDEGFFGKQPWPFASTPPDAYPLLLHYHPLTIYRHRVAKQADAVLAVALLPNRFDQDTRRRMVDVYEEVTVHDSTLSPSAFATAAARSGDPERAYRYWRASVLTDLCDLFGNSGHGLHMAALAGGWSALAFGFAGLHVDNGRLCFDPIEVPRIGRYALSVRYRTSLVRISVTDRTVTYELLGGAPVALSHSGEEMPLGERPIMRPLRA